MSIDAIRVEFHLATTPPVTIPNDWPQPTDALELPCLGVLTVGTASGHFSRL